MKVEKRVINTMEQNDVQTISEGWLEQRYRIKLYLIRENDKKVDPSLINDLYKMGYSFIKDDRPDASNVLNFYSILEMMPKPVLIVLEPYYVDMLYRDTYYHYYSEVLTEISRNCCRLSFFGLDTDLSRIIEESEIEHPAEILLDEKIQIELEKNFIGTVTLRPLYNRYIGRVLLDPDKVLTSKVFLRRTQTMVTIFGHGYKLKFFPHSGQDGLYMTCAEVSLWMIFEYFGLQYSDYHTVLPSEFIEYNAKNNPERTLPTQGMDAITKSRILKNFGLHPKVYMLDVFQKKFKSGEIDFRILFHIYVESGIPLVLSLLGDDNKNGHSVVCIGHGPVNYEVLDNKSTEYIHWENSKFELIDSSQLVDKYIIMDDNSVPYCSRPLEKLSLHINRLKYFIAPLNRKVYMDAQHATKLFGILIMRYLKDIVNYMDNSGIESRKLVRRIYLTTGRKYKTFRTKHGKCFLEKEFYASLPCAKFIWVMELGIAPKYRKGIVFAEFVLDATGGKESENAALMVRIGDKVGYHGFDESYMTNRVLISDYVFDKIVDYCQNERIISWEQGKEFFSSVLVADGSLIGEKVGEFDDKSKDELFSEIFNEIVVYCEEKKLLEDPEPIKRETKLSVESIIFEKLHRVFGERLFINPAESFINRRFVNCSQTNIFQNEFELYQNNLDEVGAGTDCLNRGN